MKTLIFILIFFTANCVSNIQDYASSFSDLQMLELSNKKYYPYSNCLFPKITDSRSVTFYYQDIIYLKNDAFQNDKQCEEKVLVSEFIVSTEARFGFTDDKLIHHFKLESNWFELYVHDEKFQKQTLIINLRIKNNKNKVTYVDSFIFGVSEKDRFMKACKSLNLFLDINSEDDLVRKLLNSKFCNYATVSPTSPNVPSTSPNKSVSHANNK